MHEQEMEQCMKEGLVGLNLGSGTGWNLRPFAAVLAPRQSSGATKYKDTVRTRNNWVHAQLGQILDGKIQQEQNPNCHFGGAKSKSWVLSMSSAHSTSKDGWGQTS